MSNRARTKQQTWASDDDAENLLAGILDDTASDAEAERSRLEAELRAKDEQERLKKQDQEQQARMSAESRLREEESRQQALVQKRTAKMEAIRVEDLKAKGEWVDPALEQARIAKEEAERRAQMDAQMQQAKAAQAEQEQAFQQAQASASPESTHKAPLLVLAAVVFAVLMAGVAIAVLSTSGYAPDEKAYAVTMLEPKDSKDLVAETSITPLPKAQPAKVVVVASNTPKKKSSARKKKRRRRSSSRRRSSKKRVKKKKRIKLKLDDSLF